MGKRSLKKIAVLILTIALLIAGCGDADESTDANVDIALSKAAFTQPIIPAYPGSPTKLLVTPRFYDSDSAQEPDIEVKCPHGVVTGEPVETDDGSRLLDVESDGTPRYGQCRVYINGALINAKPALITKRLCESQPLSFETEEHLDLAAAFAPVIYQDVGRRPVADMLAAFDFDGNWIGRDNWENLNPGLLFGTVYYSVTETVSNYFLIYGFYHPVRYGTFVENSTESHENSMSGMMVVLEKTPFGPSFLLMETYIDGQFLIYSNSPKVSGKFEPIYKSVRFQYGTHPAVFIEAARHGTVVEAPFVFGEYLGQKGADFPGGDGLVYRFKGIAEQPRNTNDRDVGYDLVPILETLWAMRDQVGDAMPFDAPFFFSKGCSVPGRFDGDNFQEDSAAPPWGWDDIDDGRVKKGDWFLFPAHAIGEHVKINGPYSLEYLYNPYIGVE